MKLCFLIFSALLLVSNAKAGKSLNKWQNCVGKAVEIDATARSLDAIKDEVRDIEKRAYLGEVDGTELKRLEYIKTNLYDNTIALEKLERRYKEYNCHVILEAPSISGIREFVFKRYSTIGGRGIRTRKNEVLFVKDPQTLIEAINEKNHAVIDAYLKSRYLSREVLGNALLLATKMNDIRIVRKLLRKNANIEVSDKWGNTPYAIAKKNSFSSMMKVLKKAGARTNVVPKLSSEEETAASKILLAADKEHSDDYPGLSGNKRQRVTVQNKKTKKAQKMPSFGFSIMPQSRIKCVELAVKMAEIAKKNRKILDLWKKSRIHGTVKVKSGKDDSLKRFFELLAETQKLECDKHRESIKSAIRKNVQE